MLRIDEEYYIDFCDRYSAALVQKVVLTKGKRKGEKEFIVRGYYGSFESLLRGYVKAVCKEPAESLKEVIERLERIEYTIGEIGVRTKSDFKELMVEETRRG